MNDEIIFSGNSELPTLKLFLADTSEINKLSLWHYRLNHISNSRISTHLNIRIPKSTKDDLCEPCIIGKSKRSPINKNSYIKRTYDPFEKLVMDCMGPFISSLDNMKGILLVTDVKTRFCWAYTFKRRSEIPD